MTLVDYKERKKNVLQKIANSHILRNHGNIQIMRVSNKENYRVRAYAVCRDETHTMTVKHLRSAPQLFSSGVSASSPQELINKGLVVQMVKNLPAMWETWVPSLGREDPLQEGMTTHSVLNLRVGHD